MGVGVLRGSWRVRLVSWVPTEPLLCVLWGEGALQLSFSGHGADPFLFQPFARTGIPLMGAMPCWMFRLLSGMCQLLVIRATASAGLNDWQSGPGVRGAAPRRNLLSCYFCSAWTPFIFPGRASSPQKPLGACQASPQSYGDTASLAKRPGALKIAGQARPGQELPGHPQVRAHILHFLSHFLGSCVENNSQNKVRLLTPGSALCVAHSSVTHSRLAPPPLPSRALGSSLLLGRFLFLEQLHQTGVPSCHLIL